MVEINKCGLLEMDEKKKIKICFAASSGGHYEQLMMLKPLMKKYDSFVITEKTDYSAESKGEKTYYMKQVNRCEKDFIWRMIQNSWKSISIYRKEKPDVVICTGVLAMIPICLISKLMGKKLIYIESFAKVTSPTETGKLLYKFADRFYVQWKPMLKFYPNSLSLTSILIPRCLSQVVLDQMNRVLLLVPICGLDWSLGKESYICLVAGIDIGIYFHHEPKG